MKTFCKAVLLLLIGLSAALANHAQEVAANSDDVARCTDWVKETVPATVRVVGSDFCRGIKRDGSPDGWYSIEKCGEQPGNDKAQVKMFCSSSGVVGPDTAVAAGFSGTGTDGGELISTTSEGGKTPTAVLYSRTPLHIANTRIPAGLSQLTFSHADRGWRMAIKPDGEKIALIVPLLSDTHQLSATGSELAVGVHYNSPRCSDLLNMRELVFTYAGTDLYVCMRPDHVPPVSDESVASQ